jgi:ankyrin repeat protein
MADQGPVVTGFFEAIRKGNDMAVDTAVARSQNLLRARDESGTSPVIVALNSGHGRLAERLAAELAKTSDGLDVFDAAATGNISVVRNLLQTDRASVDDRGADGLTPLHLAAAYGQLEMSRLLLGRGADPNAVAQNETRSTPLHVAIEAGHRDTATLLLALGASPNAIQHNGWTPLHGAAKKGDQPVVDMLLLRGADTTRANNDGKTAVDLAEEGGHAALAKVIRTAAKR